MAENNLETTAFSIESTMDFGMGSKELIDSFLSETVAPEDVTPIIKETKDTIPEKKLPKGKEIIPPKEEKEGDETPSGQDIVSSFLGTSDEEDEEEIPITSKEIEEGGEEKEEGTQFSALTKDLFKLGVFTKEDDEEETSITTAEEFLDRFQEEKKRGAINTINDFLGQFGEDYKNAFEAIYVKGVHPKDYFGSYNAIVNFAELDLTNEANQISVIKQGLTDQGFEPEDVTTEIERLQNYGDLESVAAKHHKVLVKKEAAKLKELETKAEQELQQKTAYKTQYVQNVQNILQEKLKTKEFDGIPLNPKLATELQDFLLVDRYKTPTGETLTEFDKTMLELKKPENHATKVKLALLLKIMEKDPTLSTIQKSGVSKQTDKLFGEVARQTTKTKVNSPKPQGSGVFSYLQ